MMVLLTVCGLFLSSCADMYSALKHQSDSNSQLRRERNQFGDSGAEWRTELVFSTERQPKGVDATGIWYGQGWNRQNTYLRFQNLSRDGRYNGVSSLQFINLGAFSGGGDFALVSANNRPAGEISTMTLKKLGSSDGVTYIVSYILAADGNSFRITDLGGINNHPLFRLETYTK